MYHICRKLAIVFLCHVKAVVFYKKFHSHGVVPKRSTIIHYYYGNEVTAGYNTPFIKYIKNIRFVKMILIDFVINIYQILF